MKNWKLIGVTVSEQEFILDTRSEQINPNTNFMCYINPELNRFYKLIIKSTGIQEDNTQHMYIKSISFDL